MRGLRLLITLFTLFFTYFSWAQIHNPVKWTFEQKQLSNTEFELQLIANIEKTWHMYSQHLPNSDGPIATSFTFEKGNYERVGKVEEPKPKTEYDPNFDMDLSYFEGKTVFKQKVKLKPGASTTVKGELEYMVCDAKQCLPPELVSFSFDLVSKAEEVKSEEPSSLETPVSEGILAPVKWEFSQEEKEGEVLLTFTAVIDKGWHVYSQTLPSDEGPVATSFTFEPSEEFELVGKVEEGEGLITKFEKSFEMELNYYENKAVFSQKIKPNSSDFKVKGSLEFMVCDDEKCLTPEQVPFEFEIKMQSGAEQVKTASEDDGIDRSFIGIFIAGFLGGLLALLTPCVFPMIPLTVSFFTKQSKTRAKGITNALLYAASIVGIYVLLGYGITVIFGADALNALSTNVWFNLAFFVLLVVFAISFLGAFEITLPSSWINKTDAQADKGGLIGIFFMAFTLSLVSFSCTGPIIGTLLVEAAVNGGVSGPIIGMIGFSTALALPFGLFAAFPGWLNSLPQSGGWLNSVKVTLGFLELALAFKFLSNADLVVQAGWLQRELFLAIWIAIFGVLSLYLFGFIKLSHDSEMKFLSIPRMFIGLLALLFTIYLIPGMWGAPLKLISGFPPPMFYSESPNGLGGSAIVTSGSSEGSHIPKGADPEHCPHNINCFHDYEEGMAYAKSVGKPVILDFTGWACVNCRKMEEQVWSDPRVLEKLKNDFVLISLYVDEKIELPKEEQVEVLIGDKKKKLKTVGNKWSYFQASRYGTNSQPYYVILDHNEKQLNGSAAYDPDVEKYVQWLEEGESIFNKSLEK